MNEQKIINYIKDNPSLNAAAKKFKVSVFKIHTLCKKHNVDTKLIKAQQRKEKLLELCEFGLTAKQCASAMGCSTAAIYQLSKINNITLYSKAKPKNPHTEEMILLRKSGQTLNAISKKFGITRERVRQLTQSVPFVPKCSKKKNPKAYAVWKRIKDYSEWNEFDDFLVFYEANYSPETRFLIIKDKSKPYSIENCKFSAVPQKTERYTAFGKTLTISEWLKEPICKVNRSTLVQRIRWNWDFKAALVYPKHSTYNGKGQRKKRNSAHSLTLAGDT